MIVKRVTHITADIHETIHQTVEQNQVSSFLHKKGCKNFISKKSFAIFKQNRTFSMAV